MSEQKQPMPAIGQVWSFEGAEFEIISRRGHDWLVLVTKSVTTSPMLLGTERQVCLDADTLCTFVSHPAPRVGDVWKRNGKNGCTFRLTRMSALLDSDGCDAVAITGGHNGGGIVEAGYTFTVNLDARDYFAQCTLISRSRAPVSGTVQEPETPQTPFDVECPLCKAKPGAPCTMLCGELLHVSHGARIAFSGELRADGILWQNYPGRAAWEAKQERLKSCPADPPFAKFLKYNSRKPPKITCCRCGLPDSDAPDRGGLCYDCRCNGEFMPGDRFRPNDSLSDVSIVLTRNGPGTSWYNRWDDESNERPMMMHVAQLRKAWKRIPCKPAAVEQRNAKNQAIQLTTCCRCGGDAAKSTVQGLCNLCLQEGKLQPGTGDGVLRLGYKHPPRQTISRPCDWCGTANADYSGNDSKLYCGRMCKSNHERYPRSGHSDNPGRCVSDESTVTVHGITMSRTLYWERTDAYSRCSANGDEGEPVFHDGPLSSLATRDLSKTKPRDPWDWDVDDAPE